jgi:predicted transcriptional regulator
VTTLTLRLPDELDVELHAAARADGVSVAEFAAEAVAATLEARRHAEVMAIANRVLATDAVIVHRLGTA